MKRGHVLIADDDPGLSYMAELVLRREGYTVATAANGREALSQIERRRPDLILLDVQMPVMDGWDVGRRLHASDRRDIPIVLLAPPDRSGPSREDVRAADVLAKPFDMDELLSVVTRYCAPSKAPAPVAPGRKRSGDTLTVVVVLITLAILALRIQPFHLKPGGAFLAVWDSAVLLYRLGVITVRIAMFVGAVGRRLAA
jgi:CheY-like chemotaxis protein